MPDYTTLISALITRKINFKENEELYKHTSFKIGGKAKLFIEPSNAVELIETILQCEKQFVKYFILGKGSNVLFMDSGYDGAVVHIGEKLDKITVNENTITACAGANLADVCNAARESSLTGLEFAYGIPGSVGGAVFMNAGAYDGEMKDVIKSIKCVDENGKMQVLTLEQADLGYRTSVFQKKKLYILSADLILNYGDKSIINNKMQELAKRRADKQPLDMPSAGSAFKRPEGAYAGALIDKCGLRGKRIGGAAISEKHCGFIVNCGNATCSDVLALANEVCRTVYEQTGYNLEKEIRVIK